ncbi:hypothetical protein Goshw_024243 [Gossypium schwendimanii]|uniref:Germin-like protein n=1 Tax=Gossypium schwendimanii TaxID=34291 RepID=A0A7J9LR01_GOSSC|nr:hypothetical protein [Gossypium schwendimanii]
MEGLHFLRALFILALASSLAYASDPSPLQDFCVAINDPNDAVFVNGKVCKDAKLATADDFFFSGLNIGKITSNSVGSSVTPVNVAQISGLNTLGISLARIDYAANGGLNPPHTHPRATEILVVLEGTLYVVGLVHFQFNPRKRKAVAIAALSSQDPGVIIIANAVFGSDPSINPDVLSKAFKLDKSIVKSLQSKF